MLRVAFAFENRVGTGTEDLPAAAAGKEWGKRNRRASIEEGVRGSDKDESSRTDYVEAGRRMTGLVDGGKRALWKKGSGSFQFSVAQARGWVEVGLGDGACLRSIFACGFAITLAG